MLLVSMVEDMEGVVPLGASPLGTKFNEALTQIYSTQLY